MSAIEIASIAVGLSGIPASYFISRHFYMKSRRKRNASRSTTVRKRGQQKQRGVQNDDPFTLKLDLRKQNLGLTDEKIKRATTAYFLDKIFYNTDRDAL